MLTICSMSRVLSEVTLTSSFFCFSILFSQSASFRRFSASASRTFSWSSWTYLFGALLSIRSRSTIWPNFSIWMSWNFACRSSMCWFLWFFSFFRSLKSRCSCLWLLFTSRISWCSSVMRDMSLLRPSCVKTTCWSSSAGRRSQPSLFSVLRHCTWDMRSAKTICTWFSFRCLSVWNCWISASVCFCSLSMRFSSSRSFLCCFFSSSTAFWISWRPSSISSRLSRRSMTLS
mmetsp:Transcript_116696/g.330695  ORF Transcript_116696/g.330695 Transcript_116696/m.330695 type:complete len:231 (-) Transcript_116696:1822-2514(-)